MYGLSIPHLKEWAFRPSSVNSKNTIEIIVDDGSDKITKTLSFTKGNNKPTISINNKEIGKVDSPFIINYSVNDIDKDDKYNVIERLNGVELSSYKDQVNDNKYSINIGENELQGLGIGKENIVEIGVTNNSETVKDTITFIKANFVLLENEKIIQLQDKEGNKLYPNIKYIEDKYVSRIRMDRTKELIVQKSDKEPLPVEGMIYFNTKDKNFYFGTEKGWQKGIFTNK